MNVRSFKLASGEELIATLDRATGQGYVVSKPLVVHVMRGPDGNGTLAFAQWSMIQDEDEIELFDHALLAKPVKVLAAVEDSYIKQTSSFILPPTVSKILQG
jgi:hypothetical protein